MKTLKYIAIIFLTYLFIRYAFLIVLAWGIVEVLIYSIRKKTFLKIKEFICNFVITVLNCINILCNIILQIPANRILLTTTENAPCLFGYPKKSFTRILRMNFMYGNLKPRGIALYNIISFFNIKKE